MDDEYEDDDGPSVDARSRFLTDPGSLKVMLSLVSMYASSLHEDDETVGDIEIPDISRNDKVLLLNSIFDLMQETLGDVSEGADGDEDDDDGFSDAEFASVKRKLKRFVATEVARDKRMSVYYKAFMGKMRNLVDPWHEDRNQFLQMWADMGNELFSKSPANLPRKPKKLSCEADLEGAELAAVVGSTAALPSKVMRELSSMGFSPVAHPEDGDSAWVKTGAADGFPDKQVVLARRDDDSYLVLLSSVDKYSAYGKVIQRRVLDEGATEQQLLRTIAYMYDLMTGN